MSQYTYRLSDVRDEIFTLREEGSKRGAFAGFNSLHDYYSVKSNSYTIIFAAAHQGKSQFAYEVAMNLAEFEGYKIAVCSPETGSPKDVFAELCWIYARKPFLKNDKGVHVNDTEAEAAIRFVSEHFYVIDSGIDDFSVSQFYKEVRQIEEDDDVKINMCLIDPYTEFKTGVSEGVRDDVAIGEDLNMVRKMSSKGNYHTIVTVHTKNQMSKYHNGRQYTPEAGFQDIAGGMMWSRKGFMIINLWRCPEGMEDENGRPYDFNQVKVSIRKAKPKSAGKVGHCYLWYDPVANRYYEREIDETGYYDDKRGHKKIYSYPDPNKQLTQLELI